MKRSPKGGEVAASTKERIRVVATRLFAQSGYAAATTREICQRAGVTKPVLYYHFGNKESLFREIFREACEKSREKMARALERGHTAREKLVKVLNQDFADTRENPDLSRLFFRMPFSPAQEYPAIDYLSLYNEWVGLLTSLVEEGVRGGEIRGNAREIAGAILAIHTLNTMSFLVLGKPQLNRALAERTIEFVFHGREGKSRRRQAV
jgi:AcrR family transcriptional regulator